MEAYELRAAEADFSGLVRTERERPEPAPDEVLVRMHAWSPGTGDLALADPDSPFGPSDWVPFPIVPMHSGAGEVVEVGDEVDRLAVGDRVTSRYAPNWVDGAGAEGKFLPFTGIHDVDGVLAEYVTLPAESLPVLPDHLSYEEGATLPGKGLTAWHALVENGSVSADETVFVLGTAGYSTFGIQFARMHGAETYVAGSRAEHLERAREVGAARTIDWDERDDWGEVVHEWTDGGVDHLLETGGVGTMKQSLQSTAINGQVHVVGVADKGRERDYDIHVYIHRRIFHRALDVQGVWGAGSRAMFDRMNRAIAATGMSPVVDRTFDWDEVRDAYRYVDAGENVGRVVITEP